MSRRRLAPILLVGLLLASFAPSARAGVTVITVVTDRADYVLGMPVTANGTIQFTSSFMQLDEPARVEWFDAAWVALHVEYVPKVRVQTQQIAHAVATWTPPVPGMYHANVSSNTTNGTPPTINGWADFRVWPPSDYVIARGVEVSTTQGAYERGELATAVADFTARPSWVIGNSSRLERVQFTWFYPGGPVAHQANAYVTDGIAMDSWVPDTLGANYTITATYLGNDPVSNSTNFAVFAPTTPVTGGNGTGGTLAFLGAIVAGVVIAVFLLARRRSGAPGRRPTLAPSESSRGPRELLPGTAYAILGENGDPALDRFVLEVGGGKPGVCVSRTRPEDVRTKYALEDIPLYWLSRSPRQDAVRPTNLGGIVDIVRTRTADRPGSVVLLDGLEYLMTQNDFAKVAKFVHELVDVVAERRATLLLPLNPKSLNADRLAILIRDLRTLG